MSQTKTGVKVLRGAHYEKALNLFKQAQFFQARLRETLEAIEAHLECEGAFEEVRGSVNLNTHTLEDFI